MLQVLFSIPVLSDTAFAVTDPSDTALITLRKWSACGEPAPIRSWTSFCNGACSLRKAFQRQSSYAGPMASLWNAGIPPRVR